MADPRLRITHVIPHIGIGGAELQLAGLAAATPPELAEHRILYYSDAFDDQGFQVYRNSGVPFARVGRGTGGPPVFLFKLAKAIAAGRPHIVHCWLASGALWGRWAAALAGVGHIVVGIRSRHLDLSWLLRASRLADGRRVRYLVNSTAAADAVARLIGPPRERITIIPNGIRLDLAESPPAREHLVRSHGCPPGTRIALSVGRLTELKNYPMLLRIALRCRGSLPIHFFVAGHGELEQELKDLSVAMGVADVVHFLGLRMDVPALLRASDLFCYTSRSEGMPNALLEAMAASRPIVTTRFVGVEDVVEPGVTAQVVDPDDDRGAFEAIRGILEGPEKAAALGAAARDAVEKRFSMERMVESTLEYYDRIMQGRA